jgi:RND family efflux transporter MFP subunit
MRRPYTRMLVPALSRDWPKFLSRRDNLRIAQRFSVGCNAREDQVPKGRLIGLRKTPFSAVPSGLICGGTPFPRLKPWAIVTYPFGINALFSLFISGLLAFLVGCGKKHEPTAAAGESLPPASVREQKIETVKQSVVEEVVGTVQPKLQAVIEAKVSGRITRLPVSVGQSVKQGDVLVELATQEIQARLDQANAAFRQAELDFNRVSNLHKQTAATQAEFDTAQARYTVAKGAVAEADAMSGYAKIVAPFDGVVARKLADEGDLAMPGKPLIELEGRAGLRLVADVPNLLAGHVLPDAKLTVRVDTQADPLSGTVAEISPTADPASRTVRMKLDLPETAGLRSGQFGRLAVPVGEAAFLFVPPQALIRRGQLEILFVAADGKAQMRLVRTGKETAQGIEILAGLAPGEAVVVEGAGNLRDGQPLQTR